MRWRNLEQSSNVDDRRGRSGRVVGGGVAGGLLMLVLYFLAPQLGIDPSVLQQMAEGTMQGGAGQQQSGYRPSAEEEELANFVKVGLKTTEDTWGQIFHDSGGRYTPAKLVLYTGATETACGYGQSAMGPFYCPADQSVYIDLSFYRDMQRKLGGGGDFGYVLAHEVGHHVQYLVGTANKVRQAQSHASRTEQNRLSVMMELEADCYAGVWGNHMKRRGILEVGDLEEALNTASAIGDDRLQKQSGGRVVPDSFTHGTSKQRYDWFKRGFDTGDPNQCYTYGNALGR